MNRKIFVPLIAVFIGLLVIASCTKLDTTDLGKELIPEVDNINTFEMVLDVISNNVLFNDTTRMYDYSRTQLSPHRQPVAIGEITDDPEFGKTTGAAFFSLAPASWSTYPFVKRDTVKIDSVILSLSYDSHYGDSMSLEEFEVYNIDPNAPFLDTAMAYFIKDPEFAVAGGRIGHKMVDFQTLNDSVSYVNGKDTIKSVNELRIPLDTAFARAFVNYDTALQYKSDAEFRKVFKGLAVKVNGGASINARGLAYFNLEGSNTRVTFYCRVENNGKTDTIAPSFTYSYRQHNAVRRAEQHGYQQYLNNGVANDDKIYIASSPGSYAAIQIPGLDTMTNKAIHRAELILEKIPSALDNVFAPMPVLYIDQANNAADSFFTVRGDFVPNSSSGFVYDLASLEGLYKANESRYTFNISRHVQSILARKLPNRTLRVYAPYVTFNNYESVTGTVGIRIPLPINDPIASGRVVLGGGSHPTQKMRLRIIYSKI